jgi:hypothetical protein
MVQELAYYIDNATDFEKTAESKTISLCHLLHCNNAEHNASRIELRESRIEL